MNKVFTSYRIWDMLCDGTVKGCRKTPNSPENLEYLNMGTEMNLISFSQPKQCSFVTKNET